MRRHAKMTFLFILGLMASCGDTSIEPQEKKLGRFYLEREYVNSAWGRHVHRGVFIDSGGVVITYDLGNSPEAWQGTANELYTEAELWAKLHSNDTVRGSIPADTLSWLRTLAYASVSGKMSDTVGTGADIGLSIYSCYTLEGANSLFRRTELRVEGDLGYHNTSPGAIELANWMALRN